AKGRGATGALPEGRQAMWRSFVSLRFRRGNKTGASLIAAATVLVAREHVVIVGGGFGGLAAALALRKTPVRVTLIDRRNYHLFQPLLYQVGPPDCRPPTSPHRSVRSYGDNATRRFSSAR